MRIFKTSFLCLSLLAAAGACGDDSDQSDLQPGSACSSDSDCASNRCVENICTVITADGGLLPTPDAGLTGDGGDDGGAGGNDDGGNTGGNGGGNGGNGGGTPGT